MPQPDTWIFAQGSWSETAAGLTQRDPEGVGRCWRDIGGSHFTAEYTMTAHPKGESGEIKFLFAQADQGETYRIDFMYGNDTCRVKAGKWATALPLSLTAGRDVRVRVSVTDNLLSISVDDFSILEGFSFGMRSDGRVGFGTFNARAAFRSIALNPLTAKACFVIMPFDEKRNLLYELVIKPTLGSHPRFRFEIVRADEKLTTGRISEEIVEEIRNADLVIADITEPNLNVFYELGYAHACSRKAVLLIQKVEGKTLDLPFDIQDFRCHPYSYTQEDFNRLKGALVKLADSLLGKSGDSSKERALTRRSRRRPRTGRARAPSR